MENVLLVFGGRSYEHDISIVTASQIFNKTRLENFNLIPFYISKNNKFFIYKSENFNLKDFVNFDDNKHTKKFKEVLFISSEKAKLFSKTMFGLKEILSVDLAIIACHGGDGENGKLVSFLEKNGIYCSAGSSEGLLISMNKILFKNVMRTAKLPIVSGFVVNEKLYFDNKEYYNKKLKFMKFPLILKPAKGGSSIGLFVAKNRDEFEEKLFSAFEFDSDVLIEKFISGAREFNVAVFGDENKQVVSEIDEPLKINEILSFNDKYLGGSKSHKGGIKNDNSMLSQKRKFPAEISDKLKSKLQNLALKTFNELNLFGVVRIDFLYDEKREKIYICEVNAVPGSLAYYFFSKGEVLLNSFVLKLIDIAKKKSKEKENFKDDFITTVLS